MSETIENDINSTPKPKQGNILGLVGLIISIIAWVILYKYQWGGISFAIISIILSSIGLKGRFHNLAIGGILLSSILLIVMGIMWIVFYYLFQSI